MAATGAISGKGTTLGHSTTSGGTYTTVAEVTNSSIPELSVMFVEATHYTSDSGYIERISTDWKDLAEVPFTVNYLKSEMTTFMSIVGTKLFWKLTLSDGSTFVWGGTISKMSMPVPIKDRLQSTISLTNSGALTFTAGS